MTEETTTPRQSQQDTVADAKLADAFRDLEPVILDLERGAKIAEKFFIEDPDEEELELGRFAVYQFRAMASDLVRLWNEKHEAARTKLQSASKKPALAVVQQDTVADTGAA